MDTGTWLEISYFVEAGACLAVLIAFLARRAQRVFPSLTMLLAAQMIEMVVTIGSLFFRRRLHMTIPVAYMLYYWTTWLLSGIVMILRIMTVYAVFAEAMRPLAGLHQAGKMIFRWVGVVSGVVALALVTGPGTLSGAQGIMSTVSHLQQGVSVLTLCLLVFVCFAVRPLGLTFRSHIFGVALGLGVASTVELLQAAWLVTHGALSLYSSIYLFYSVGMSVSLLIWGVYFGMPEPARRMILLPTTSPFFFWNRISEILGDSPGHVAVAGFTPDMLAPAEIEMLTAATANEVNEITPPTEAFEIGYPLENLSDMPEPSLA